MVEFPPSYGDKVRATKIAECFSGKPRSEETGLKENRGDAVS